MSVLSAESVPYRLHLRLAVRPGPDPALIVADVRERIEIAARARCLIGGEVPTGFFRGIAFASPLDENHPWLEHEEEQEPRRQSA